MDWDTNWDAFSKKRAAIGSINPAVRFHWSNDSDTITWSDDNTETLPTDAEIDSEIIRLDAEYTALAYSRARALAYPSIEEQLDMLYWDKKNDTNNWEIYIDTIKEKYPKE